MPLSELMSAVSREKDKTLTIAGSCRGNTEHEKSLSVECSPHMQKEEGRERKLTGKSVKLHTSDK